MNKRADHIQRTIKYSTDPNHHIKSPPNQVKANILAKPQYDPANIMKNNFINAKNENQISNFHENKQRNTKYDSQKVQKYNVDNGIQILNHANYSPFINKNVHSNGLGINRTQTTPIQEINENQNFDFHNNEYRSISKNQKYITQFQQNAKHQNKQKLECFFDDSNTDGFQYLKQDSNIFKRSDNLSYPETNQDQIESVQSRASISQVPTNENRRKSQKAEDFKKIQTYMQIKLPFESLNKLLFSLLQQIELVKYILKQPSQNQTRFSKCQEASQKVLETIIKHFYQFHNAVATTQQRIQIYPIDMNDLEDMFYMLNNFSMIFLEKGEIESSTQFIQVAIQMNMHYNEIKSNKIMQQTLYQNLSAYHLKSGQSNENVSQSLKYIEGALTVIKMMGDELNQADIQNNQQPKQLQQYKLQNQTNYAISLNNKAVIELRNQNYEVSKQLSIQSIQIMEQRVFGMINSGLIMQVQQNSPQDIELSQNDILFNESLNILLISYFNLAMSTQDHLQRIDIFQIGMQFCHQYIRNCKKSQIFIKFEKNYYKSAYYEALRQQDAQNNIQQQQDFQYDQVEQNLPEIIPIDFIEKNDDQSIEIQNELFLKNEVHLSRPQQILNQKNSFTILNSSRSKNSINHREQARVVLLRNQDSYASLPQEQQKRHAQVYKNQNLYDERDNAINQYQNNRKAVPFQPLMSELTKPVKRVSKYDKFDTGMLMRNSQKLENNKLKLEQQQMPSMNIGPQENIDEDLQFQKRNQNNIQITNLCSETTQNIYQDNKLEKIISISKSLNDRESLEKSIDMNNKEKVQIQILDIQNGEIENNEKAVNNNILSIEANETPLFFKNTGKFQTNHSGGTNEQSIKSKVINSNCMNFTLNKNQNEKDKIQENLQIKLEEQKKQEIERQQKEEIEKQRILEFEKFKLEEKKKLEAEKQRIQELEKQQREQFELLKQIELEKIRKEEQERIYKEQQLKIQQDLEKQRKEEQECKQKEEQEKQKQAEIEKQKKIELERKQKEEQDKKLIEDLEKQKMDQMAKEMDQLRLKLEEQMKFNQAQQELMKNVIDSYQQNNIKEKQVSINEQGAIIKQEDIFNLQTNQIQKTNDPQNQFETNQLSNDTDNIQKSKLKSLKISDTDNKNKENKQITEIEPQQFANKLTKDEKNQKFLDELQKERKSNIALQDKNISQNKQNGENQYQFLLKNDKVVNKLNIQQSQSSESLVSKQDIQQYKDLFEVREVSAEHNSDINKISEIIQKSNQKIIHQKIQQKINKNTQMDLWITDNSKLSFLNKKNDASGIQSPADSLTQKDLNQQIQDIAMRFERSPRNFLYKSRINVQEQIRHIQSALKERKEFHGYQLEQPNYEQILNLIMSNQNTFKLENIDFFGTRQNSQLLIQKQYDMLLFNLSQNQVNTLIFVREYQYLFNKKKLWLKNQQLLNDIVVKKKIICKKIIEVNPKIFSNEQKKSFQKDIFQSLMFKVYIEAEFKSDQNLDQVLQLMQNNPDNDMVELLKIHILSNIKVKIGSFVSNQQKSILENISLDCQEISLLELQTILCMIEDESVVDPWNDKFNCSNQPFYQIDTFDMLCQYVLFPYIKICQVENDDRFQFIVDFNERPFGVFQEHLPIKFLMSNSQTQESKNNIKQINLNNPYVNAYFNNQQNGNSNEDNILENQFLQDQLKLLPGHSGLNCDINFYQIGYLNYKLIVTPLLDLQTMLFIKLINNQTHVETNNEDYENQNKAQEILNCMETMIKMDIRCVGQLQIDVNFRNKYISDKMFKKVSYQDIKFFNESSYPSQQNVYEFHSTVQEKNSQSFYQKYFKKFLDVLEEYLLAEYKDWYKDLLREKQGFNFMPKDEMYKELLINVGDQQIQSKFNLEEHQRLISMIIHLKVVHVQIDFQDVMQSPQSGFQAEMHIVHRIKADSQEQPDLKLTSFYTEGPNGDIKSCQSIKFGSKQLKQMFGQRCKNQESLYDNYLLNQLCILKLRAIKIQFQFLDLSKSSISIQSQSEKSESNSEIQSNSVSNISSSKAIQKKEDFNIAQLKEFQIENTSFIRQIKIVKIQNQNQSISVPVTFSILICKNLKIIIGVKIVLFDIYGSCEERGLFLIANQDLWPRIKNQPQIAQNDFTSNYSLNYLMSEVGYDYLIDNFIQFYKINDSKNNIDSDDDICKIHEISLRIKEQQIYGCEEEPKNPNKLEDPNFLNIDKDSLSQNEDEIVIEQSKYEISSQTYKEEDSCSLAQLDKYVNVKQLTDLLSRKYQK